MQHDDLDPAGKADVTMILGEEEEQGDQVTAGGMHFSSYSSKSIYVLSVLETLLLLRNQKKTAGKGKRGKMNEIIPVCPLLPYVLIQSMVRDVIDLKDG